MKSMQILDGVLIANKLIDSRRLSEQVGVIFKIEMGRLTIMWIGILLIIC